MVLRPATLAVLAALTLSLAALPALAAAQSCTDAQSDFWNTWATEGERFTRPAALAARAVLDACSVEEPARTSGGGDVETQAPARTMAALCGFAGRNQSPPTPATVKGWIMVGPKQWEDVESGTGTATFDAPTGYIQVQAAGVKWAIDVNNRGTGVITYQGVPFPLVGAYPKNDVIQAEAGCGVPPSPTLCWGTGYGMTQIPFVGAISAAGEFHACH